MSSFCLMSALLLSLAAPGEPQVESHPGRHSPARHAHELGYRGR